ncbi:NHLP bacteriocin export ABC transporter permease/ATPase subunit [Cyanobacterium aponinum]|uniref:NHLP bacteriocin export ABC transporter permease/ATPase subunit n=1 Tax=Cyanobacterium aponinum 0216 TaxID=2676140 RepID=A0A844GUV4_9CHRO|nr:NHLP bacteriocin export ABC transporter permease/ATPase subunit [Cyanobacterium aponinum]MTF40244.1 NHLP bacteriocin export ABC transporter permease/ATPase subunit [Cyanobacterium aponinum 0216]
MTEQTLLPEQILVKGNEPLLLNDPQTVWLVESGSVVLFSTLIEDDKPQDIRRYLFTAVEGEILLGVDFLSDEYGIIAVGLEETVLRKFSFQDFFEPLIQKTSDSDPNQDLKQITPLETWLHHWDEWLARQYVKIAEFPLSLVTAEGSHFISLIEGQSLQARKGQVAWIDVRSGSFHWMGLEEIMLESNCSVFPLTPEMWLNTKEQTEIYTCPTSDLENCQDLSLSLNQFHRYLLHYLRLVVVKEQEENFQQFQQRQELNVQVTESALGGLKEVLHPEEVGFFQEGMPLLVAAGAIGRVQGITVLPPAKSEDLSRIKDPLDAIARASQFRTRRVLLMGEWWKQENGPLLAYTLEENNPVALLPHQGNKYVLFDPITKTKTPVNEAIAETLSVEAYMFYRPLPSGISHFLEVFKFGIRGYEKDVIAIGVMGTVGTLMGMVTPQATNLLVNNAIPDSDQGLLWQIGLALFAAAFGQAAFQLAQGIFSLRVESAADGVLQPAVWDRLIKLSPAFFRKYATGDLLVRLLAVGQIRSQLSGATQRTLLSGIFALLNLGLMFIYSVKLALVAMGITLVAAIVTTVSSTMLVRRQRKTEELDGELNGLSIELINGVSKLRVAAAEERAFAAWAKKFGQRTKLMAGIQRINDSVTVVTEVLPLMSSVLLFWFAIMFIQGAIAKGIPGGLNAGTFLAFNSAFGTFFSGVTDLSVTITDVLEIVPLWERAKPILDGKPEADVTSADPGRLTGRFTVDHVTFRYREDGPLILDDVTIEANPGEFIALVGPSGSGKSTIMRLLLGFETPLAGTIYYDGQDLAGLNPQAVRRQLGVVLQNGRIGAGSLFDNITSGALVTLDEAWEAARMAGFAEDIEQMPMGMHTVISEGGTNLSGGQRQRLLIARALVLKPKIIFLDEATSALDNRTQSIVTKSLDRMNATRVAVAHRLSTIRNADRIYVLEAGRVVQVGNFDQLIQEDGLFARLAARQLE